MTIPFTKVTDQPHPECQNQDSYGLYSNQCLVICGGSCEIAEYFDYEECWKLYRGGHLERTKKITAWYELPEIDEEWK